MGWGGGLGWSRCGAGLPGTILPTINGTRGYDGSKNKAKLLIFNIIECLEIDHGPLTMVMKAKNDPITQLVITATLHILAAAWQNQQNDLCTQRRLRSA